MNWSVSVPERRNWGERESGARCAREQEHDSNLRQNLVLQSPLGPIHKAADHIWLNFFHREYFPQNDIAERKVSEGAKGEASEEEEEATAYMIGIAGFSA